MSQAVPLSLKDVVANRRLLSEDERAERRVVLTEAQERDRRSFAKAIRLEIKEAEKALEELKRRKELIDTLCSHTKDTSCEFCS